MCSNIALIPVGTSIMEIEPEATSIQTGRAVSLSVHGLSAKPSEKPSVKPLVALAAPPVLGYRGITSSRIRNFRDLEPTRQTSKSFVSHAAPLNIQDYRLSLAQGQIPGRFMSAKLAVANTVGQPISSGLDSVHISASTTGRTENQLGVLRCH